MTARHESARRSREARKGGARKERKRSKREAQRRAEAPRTKAKQGLRRLEDAGNARYEVLRVRRASAESQGSSAYQYSRPNKRSIRSIQGIRRSGNRERRSGDRKGNRKRTRMRKRKRKLKKPTISGDNGEGDPPVPIPNTAVKPFSVESTWLDTAREDRSSPDSNIPQ